MPLNIELSLVDDMTEPIMSKLDLTPPPPLVFTDANTSLTCSIINVQVKCDLVTLDSGLIVSYIKLLAEGKKLTLNYKTFISE